MRLLYLLVATIILIAKAEYQDTWESLDARPLPAWYDEVKFGIFCHWGVYSVPAYGSEWFWWRWQGDTPDKTYIDYVNKNYKPGTTYADFAKDFTAELFNPDEFVKVVQSSGAKYFVITSKHHEGFTMWPSRNSWNWNSVDVGPKRDILGELKRSFNNSGVHFGLYFSLFEWFHPMFIQDSKENTTEYRDMVSYPQMLDIVNRYEPEVFWSDGEWSMTDTYWESKKFLQWLYNESPVKDRIVVNDRWGSNTMGKHGGFMTYADHYDPGKLLSKKWENCLTMDKQSWGFRRNMQIEDIQNVHDLVEQLARTISCGGNMLLNVGPDNHGRIPLIFQERLAEMGKFLSTVSDAVYGTKPWIHQNDTGNVWYTSRYRQKKHGHSRFLEQLESETVIYAWVLNITGDDIFLKNVKATPKTIVSILGTDVTYNPEGSFVTVPARTIPWRKLPRTDVIVLKIERAATQKRTSLQRKKIIGRLID